MAALAHLDVSGLRGEVEGRVALEVGRVVVDEGEVLQQLQHLDHAVAAKVAHRSLERRQSRDKQAE